MKLKGQNAIVTGANRGIGKAVADRFSMEGCNVFCCARTKSDTFDQFCDTLSRRDGTTITPVYFDLLDPEAVKEGVGQILKAASMECDVLVNCAGAAHGGLFAMTSVETIREIFQINLFAHMEITQRVLRAMTRRKKGCIINVASIAGLDLHAGNAAYGVSKAAVIAWTKTLAAETGAQGVRVNAVAPGLTDTDMAKQMEPKAALEMVENSVMKRLAEPREIAAVAAFLASGDASFINGQVIRIDGGCE